MTLTVQPALEGRNVLLIVTGGIAAYKAPIVVRELTGSGASVRVVMTHGAGEFVAPLALQSVSGHSVGESVFDPEYEREIGHIELARWADAVLVAPATANAIAKMAHGLADDLATTILLATTAPVVVAPAMNTQMLNHPATRSNLETLRQRDGVDLIPTDAGDLACGEVGPGRMPDPDILAAYVARALTEPTLSGRRVLVTAGGTRERLDGVRYLTNPSSGKMGAAIAGAAWARGADVYLVRTRGSVPAPPGVETTEVETAAEMEQVVARRSCDALVMVAAVADYRPANPLGGKRKKDDDDWTVVLERTTDILATRAAAADRPELVIGFAAETSDVVENARRKLRAKGVDAIVANDVSGPDGAFGSDDNKVWILARDGSCRELERTTKAHIAEQIADWIARWEGGDG